jgi:hypothetical protein
MRVMIESRAEASVSHVGVAKEFDAVSKAMESLNAARASTIDLHNGLWRLAKLLRIPTRSFTTTVPSTMFHEETVAEPSKVVNA